MEQSLSTMFPQRAALINLLLMAALMLLLIGIFSPMITLEKFFIFSNQVSLFSGLIELQRQNEWFLFFLIGLFSVVFPIVKLFLLGVALNMSGDKHHGPLSWLESAGKWSMLDVFVVALLVVSVKFKGIATVEVHFGAYAFAFSVLLTMGLVQWVHQLVGQVGNDSVIGLN